MLLNSGSSLRGRSGNIYGRRHRSRAHVSVFLIERLPQMLGTSYHGPASGTSATTTTAWTQMSRMPMMTVGMTRMGCRTYYLALPIKRKTKFISPYKNLKKSKEIYLKKCILNKFANFFSDSLDILFRKRKEINLREISFYGIM